MSRIVSTEEFAKRKEEREKFFKNRTQNTRSVKERVKGGKRPWKGPGYLNAGDKKGKEAPFRAPVSE